MVSLPYTNTYPAKSNLMQIKDKNGRTCIKLFSKSEMQTMYMSAANDVIENTTKNKG